MNVDIRKAMNDNILKVDIYYVEIFMINYNCDTTLQFYENV